MRLTGGEGRGRRLGGPEGSAVRPTADRVREALFDILGVRISEARFLDVFGGTGAVGIEALSRGAARVVFLERDRRMLRLIARNLKVGSWRGTVSTMPGDAARSLRVLATRGERFGVVFLDPPYDSPVGPVLLAGAAALLEATGILVVEHRASRPVEVADGGTLTPGRAYRYGDTGLSTFFPASGRPPG